MYNMALKTTLLFLLADREAFLSLLLRVVSFRAQSTSAILDGVHTNFHHGKQIFKSSEF